MAHIQSSQYYVIYYYYCVIGSSLQKSVVGAAIYGTSEGMLYGGYFSLSLGVCIICSPNK